MANPDFWQAEDLNPFLAPEPDDGDYHWVLRDYEWVAAKISQGRNAKEFIATVSGGEDEPFDCKEDDIFEAIPSVAGLRRLPDDLVHADDMSERSIVHTLSERFYRDDIYTSVGDILIALNPFRPLPLYSPLVMQEYMSAGIGDVLKPHPFDISRRAYNSMLTDGRNQAILISGESGAGKTETTKLCLSFLSEAAGSRSGIEQKILSANPILEAFGNAKTLRNNNSSRFGKFMNLSFDVNGVVVGCGTTNYLLEKSRVHKLAAGERSYHIFYQICNAFCEYAATRKDSKTPMSYQRRQTLRELDSPQFKSARADLSRLELARPEEFCFLTQSNCITLPNVSDAEKFHEMEFACIRLGLTKPELEDAFSVCGAILHLGNLEFIDNTDGNGGCVLKEVSSVTSALENASRLMGLSEEEVSLRLRSRELVVRGEVNVVQLNKTQAGEARDALCKVMYKNCFDWLVERTNIAMIDPHATPEAIANERGRYHKPPTSSRKFIGILDIFGFEIFELNGFEQLCINYANEKLQQHFNQHTFKDELAACERENIPFENFTFSDNADVLDLIEAKAATGVLSIMDDECRVPRSTGETFLNKLREKHSKHPRFVAGKGEAFRNSFAIDHYAGRVFYTVQEFLEKNRDTLSEDLDRLLKQSYLSFEAPKTAAQLRQEEEDFRNSSKGKAKPKKLTLGGQFRIQLDELVKKLNESAPHFIRCVKPNDSKQAQFFHGLCVHQQLKQSGAFDALGIRKRGYNFQFKHEVFISRYGPLVRDKSNRRLSSIAGSRSKREMCMEIIKLLTKLRNLENADKNIQVGNTMVFWKAAEDRQLSSLRRHEIQGQVVCVQKMARGMIARSQYGKMKKEIESIASLIKGVVDRRNDFECTLANENKSMEDILSAKIKLRQIPIRCSWGKVVENESKLTNDRIEVLNKLDRIKDVEPRDIDENWLNVVEKAMDLNLRSPLMTNLFSTYRDFKEKCAPLLRRIGAVLAEDDVEAPVLHSLLADLQVCRDSVPGFAEKEEAKLRHILEQLEKEDELIQGVLALCSNAPPGTMPSEDYAKQILHFAAANASAVGRKVRAALRLVDYILEVRELMLKTTRQASNEDPSARPIMPPPPPPKPTHRSSQRPPPPPPSGGRGSVTTSSMTPAPPIPAATSTTTTPGGTGESELWVPVELLMKQYDEVATAVQSAQVNPVVQIGGTEISCYTLCITDCKKIVVDGAAALGGRNIRDAEKVISDIEELNRTFPSRAPYLIVSRENPGETDRGYGALLDLQAKNLFAALHRMLEDRVQALKTEDASVKLVLQTLEENEISVGDLFATEMSRPPVLSNTLQLEEAVQRAKSCSSGTFLFPSTDSIIRMAEYILSLRKLGSTLIERQMRAGSVTTYEDAGWSELKKLVAQDQHHSSHMSSTNAREIDSLRHMLLDRNATLVDAERTKEIADSLRRAIHDEDEGQVKFLLAEIATLPERQRSVLSKENIDGDVDTAKVLLEKLDAVKQLLSAGIADTPYELQKCDAALAAADELGLRHTKSLDLYMEVGAVRGMCADLVERAHRSWNNGDVDAMVSVVEAAAERNVQDDEITFVTFLVEKWREEYGAFLRALIDLNTFLEREAEVQDLNEKLNDYYFSLNTSAAPEPEKDVSSSDQQPSAVLVDSLCEFQARHSMETTSLDSAERAPDIVIRRKETVTNATFRRDSLPRTGGNIVREMVRQREQQALLAAQRPVAVEPARYGRRTAMPAELAVDENGDVSVDDEDRMDVMSQQDEEGFVFIWYRFKGLRRFADPDLEFARKMFGTESIPTSVTRLTSQNEIKLAVASFKCLLGAMGDQVCSYPLMMVDEFCVIACKSPSLADEAYCQIVKQLTANPSQSSRSKGIAIFKRLVQTAVPSRSLQPYIEHFLRDNSELEILHVLQQRLRNVGTTQEGSAGDVMSSYSGYLTLVKGKLLPVHLKRYCVVNADALIISMSDDPSSRVDALLTSEIREVRVRKGCDVAAKGRFPFELEMKNSAVKVFYAANSSERSQWMQAFKAARYQYWAHGGKPK